MVKGIGKAERRTPDRGGARLGPAAGVRRPAAAGAVRRPAAAGRAGPRAGQPAAGAPARRAAGRPGPQAPRADAGRAQGDPARGRHHLPVRHPRPGGGPDDERPDRRLQPGPHRAGRDAPTEVYEHPSSAFVAGFVGTANLLQGEPAAALLGRQRPGVVPAREGPGRPARRDRVRRRGRRRRAWSSRSSTPASASRVIVRLDVGAEIQALVQNTGLAADDAVGRGDRVQVAVRGHTSTGSPPQTPRSRTLRPRSMPPPRTGCRARSPREGTHDQQQTARARRGRAPRAHGLRRRRRLRRPAATTTPSGNEAARRASRRLTSRRSTSSASPRARSTSSPGRGTSRTARPTLPSTG